MGCVIGWHIVGGQEAQDLEDRKDIWMVIGFKYCPDMEPFLPYYTYMETKAHNSKIWPDRIRYASQPFMTGMEVGGGEAKDSVGGFQKILGCLEREGMVE